MNWWRHHLVAWLDEHFPKLNPSARITETKRENGPPAAFLGVRAADEPGRR